MAKTLARKNNQRRASKKSKANVLSNLTHRKFVIRIAHHQHSGKRLPFHSTSYAILFFLLAFTTCLLIFAGQAVRAYETIGNNRAITLKGFSKGPPPDTAAEITSPLYKNVFDESGVEIEGICEPGLFIEIYRNDVLAGGAICSDAGTFKVFITLVPGKNIIYTKIHDALYQYGPESKRITLWYNVPDTLVPPLMIKTKAVQKGILHNQDLHLSYSIAGGQEPYSVYIDWGDGTVAEIVHVNKPGTQNVSHKYRKTGQFVITIRAADKNNQQFTIQTVIVVHPDSHSLVATGLNECTGSSCGSLNIVRLMNWAWPALIVATLMTLSFWIGEKVAYTQRRAQNAA